MRTWPVVKIYDLIGTQELQIVTLHMIWGDLEELKDNMTERCLFTLELSKLDVWQNSLLTVALRETTNASQALFIMKIQSYNFPGWLLHRPLTDVAEVDVA